MFIKKVGCTISAFYLYLLGLIIASLMLGCANSKTLKGGISAQEYQPISTYTPQTTYEKYKKNFPVLTLPDMTLLSSTQTVLGQIYKSTPSRALRLDWFFPNEISPTTFTLILVHGGGWGDGSKENMHALAMRLAAKGIASVAVNYRLSGEAPYPAAVEDIKDAVAFVQQNVTNYGLSVKKIAIAGGSAGGQLAALVGVTGNRVVLPSNNQLLLPLVAIINLDGLMDFTLPAALRYENDPNKNPSAAGAWFEGRFEQIPERWLEASANTHINKETPPILFIRSSMPRFSVGYSEAIKKLRGFGIDSEEYLFADAPHSFWLFDPWLDFTVEKINRFLHLYGSHQKRN